MMERAIQRALLNRMVTCQPYVISIKKKETLVSAFSGELIMTNFALRVGNHVA